MGAFHAYDIRGVYNVDFDKDIDGCYILSENVHHGGKRRNRKANGH